MRGAAFMAWCSVKAQDRLHLYITFLDHSGRPRRRWENNTKKALKEIILEGVEWMHLAQDRGQWQALADTIINLRVP
jgi:hypothetical protein